MATTSKHVQAMNLSLRHPKPKKPSKILSAKLGDATYRSESRPPTIEAQSTRWFRDELV